MTDEEVEKHYEAMEQFFNVPLPHPEREPKRFTFFVKMYRYYLERNSAETSVDTVEGQ